MFKCIEFSKVSSRTLFFSLPLLTRYYIESWLTKCVHSKTKTKKKQILVKFYSVELSNENCAKVKSFYLIRSHVDGMKFWSTPHMLIYCLSGNQWLHEQKQMLQKRKKKNNSFNTIQLCYHRIYELNNNSVKFLSIELWNERKQR